MATIVWEPRLEIGIDVIDAQHQSLFAAAQELSEAFKSGQAAGKVTESLDFLARYTVEHFQTEERFMKAMGYPGLAAHRQEHARFISRLQMLQVKHGNGYLVSADVATFLAEWLAHHIQEQDMGYVEFTRTRIRG